MPVATLLRDGVDALSSLAARDLDVLWRSVNDAVQAREALLDVLPGMVETYGEAAGSLAADWYDEIRFEAAVAGRFQAIPAPVVDTGADALARWGVQSLFGQTFDVDSASTLVAGGLQRRIANAARETVTFSSVQDPSARGWQRAGRGECAFCALLIGRGAVYTEASADFASHDHCHCTATPAFKGEPRPVKAYTPSSRHGSVADYKRARAYIAGT